MAKSCDVTLGISYLTQTLPLLLNWTLFEAVIKPKLSHDIILSDKNACTLCWRTRPQRINVTHKKVGKCYWDKSFGYVVEQSKPPLQNYTKWKASISISIAQYSETKSQLILHFYTKWQMYVYSFLRTLCTPD